MPSELYAIEDNVLKLFRLKLTWIEYNETKVQSFISPIDMKPKLLELESLGVLPTIEKIDVSRYSSLDRMYVEDPSAIPQMIKDCLKTERVRRSRSIESYREDKRQEVSEVCTQIIYDGIEVETSRGIKRFSLESHDQIQLLSLKPLLDEALLTDPTAERIPYHANGEICSPWNAIDFEKIYQAAEKHRFYHSIYCNHLNMWINRADSDEIDEIEYGSELPEDIKENFESLLLLAQR